jgi:hypothetical protein
VNAHFWRKTDVPDSAEYVRCRGVERTSSFHNPNARNDASSRGREGEPAPRLSRLERVSHGLVWLLEADAQGIVACMAMRWATPLDNGPSKPLAEPLF